MEGNVLQVCFLGLCPPHGSEMLVLAVPFACAACLTFDGVSDIPQVCLVVSQDTTAVLRDLLSSVIVTVLPGSCLASYIKYRVAVYHHGPVQNGAHLLCGA